MSDYVENIAKLILLSNNIKRGVIFEKYHTPKWFFDFIQINHQLNGFDSDILYKALLRIANGAEITITHNTEAQINKFDKSYQIIPYYFASLLIELGIVGLQGGNEEFEEEHYNIYSI